MPKYEVKTKKNEASVETFLDSITDETKRKDSLALVEMMRKITKEEPKMWGSSMVGFGSYHYKGKGGGEGDWMLTGFSPRKGNLSIYIIAGFDEFKDLMPKLGKYKTSVGCLYVNKLEDVDQKVLKELISGSVKLMKARDLSKKAK